MTASSGSSPNPTAIVRTNPPHEAVRVSVERAGLHAFDGARRNLGEFGEFAYGNSAQATFTREIGSDRDLAAPRAALGQRARSAGQRRRFRCSSDFTPH